MKTNMPIEAFVLGCCSGSKGQWLRLFIQPNQVDALQKVADIRKDFEFETDEDGAHWAKVK